MQNTYVLPYNFKMKAFKGATRELAVNLIDEYAKQYTENDPVKALSYLLASTDLRKKFLNKSIDGHSRFYNLSLKGLEDYLNKNVTSDVNASATVSYLQNENNILPLFNEFLGFAAKELGISNAAIEEIEEDAGNSIVKKNDNEIDFYSDAKAQMKLLTYTQSIDPDGVYPLNGDTVTYILLSNLAGNYDSEQFFNKLKEIPRDSRIAEKYGKAYVEGISNIIDLIGLNRGNDASFANRLVQNNLFASFAKAEIDYRVLKVEDEEGGFDSSFNYRMIQQSTEKSKDQVKTDLINGIQDRFDTAKTRTDDKLLVGDLFNIIPNQVFNSNQIGGIAKTVRNTKDAQEYVKNNKGNISQVVKYLAKNNEEKIFSLFNAEGNLQYSLQNPSSLHKRLAETDFTGRPLR